MIVTTKKGRGEREREKEKENGGEGEGERERERQCKIGFHVWFEYVPVEKNREPPFRLTQQTSRAFASEGYIGRYFGRV